jgi:thiol:disulfide interchange protein DsbD
MLWTLLGIFVGGIALNLTPCIYPLIPITVSYFGGQSARGRRNLMFHGACYVGGRSGPDLFCH